MSELGRPEAGIPFALRAVAQAPGDADALRLLAYLQSRDHRAEEALRTADQAVAADPEHEWGHRLRAAVLQELGRAEDAADAAGEAVRLAPTDRQPLYVFAWFASSVERHDEAFAAGQRVAELYPDHPDSWFALGWAAWSAGHLDVAKDALERARAIAPELSSNHNNLGAFYARQGRTGEALACFERALAVDPESPYAYGNAAYCLRRLARWQEAEDLETRHHTNKIHRADVSLAKKETASARAARGVSLRLLGRLDEAKAELSRALELADGASQRRPLMHLSLTTLMLGEDDLAHELTQRLYTNFSTDRYALTQVALAAWFLGDQELVVKAAAAAKCIQPEGIGESSCAATAALSAGEWQLAVEHNQRMLELHRRTLGDCCPHAKLAYAYSNLGNTDQAKAEITETQLIDPRCTTLRLLRDRFGFPSSSN